MLPQKKLKKWLPKKNWRTLLRTGLLMRFKHYLYTYFMEHLLNRTSGWMIGGPTSSPEDHGGLGCQADSQNAFLELQQIDVWQDPLQCSLQNGWMLIHWSYQRTDNPRSNKKMHISSAQLVYKAPMETCISDHINQIESVCSLRIPLSSRSILHPGASPTV